MTLFRKNYGIKKITLNKISISDAIARACDGADYDRGRVETAQATADNTAKLLGELISLLVGKGVLAETEVVDVFLNDDYEVKK